jgi:cytochrome b pre-mRNA-processing protein 3
MTYRLGRRFATLDAESVAERREMTMVFGLFRTKRPPIADKLHAEIVAAARRPVFYADLGVPDTVDGRFELLCVHLFLYLRRTKAEPGLAELTQEVLDRTFADLDRNLREAGVGDLSVPKKMKRLAGMFYGRVALYAPLVEAGDIDGLGEALTRTVYAEATATPDAVRRLAHYIVEAGHTLATQPVERLLSGDVAFATP